MARPKSNAKQPKPKRASRSEEVVRYLLHGIMKGEIEARSPLIPKMLTATLGVSPTPVREALVELKSLGMVTMSHHHGAKVLPFGRSEHAEFYFMRRLQECEMARLCCGKVPPEKLTALCAQMHALPQKSDPSWLPSALAFDSAVHRTLREHCGNERLVFEHSRYLTMSETLRLLNNLNAAVMHDSYPTIVEVLDFLEKGDAERTMSAMYEHISIVAKCSENVLFHDRPDEFPSTNE
jgi:DNA-binding GntR family transcriptional regulator